MKGFTKTLLIVCAMGIAGQVSADCCDDDDVLDIIVGVEYYQAWMKPKGDYNILFPKTYPGGTLYLGARFLENFGIEAGYDWSTKKFHNWTLSSGQTFMSSPVGRTFTGTSQIRRTGGHIDFIGYIPLCYDFELFGSIGYGWVQTKIREINLSVSPGITAQTSAVSSLNGNGRSVLRLGIGSSYMVTDWFGVRAKLGFEGTAALRMTSNLSGEQLGYSERCFKNSGTVAAGVFVKF